MASKAFSIMRKVRSIETRAEKFSVTISRNIQKDMLDRLIDQKEKLEDEIESLLDFSLETNLNKGMRPITREEAETRFKQAIEKSYDLKLLKKEIKIKQKIFNSFFVDSEELVKEEGTE